MSFITKLNALKFRLEENQAMNNYFQTHFGKSLTVKRIFKNRIEIDTRDIPIILITAPRIERKKVGNVIERERTVCLYIGFLQNDYEKAQDNLIEIDEMIETAVVTKTDDAKDSPMAVFVHDSMNDEGIFHPVYFLVMYLTVKEK